jgi:hypothetical protein
MPRQNQHCCVHGKWPVCAGRVSALLILALTLSASLPIAWAQRAGQPSQRPPAGADLEKGTARQPIIIASEGRLTVRVRNLPLERVLEEISRKAQLAIVKAPGVGREPISVEFQELPVDEGLRRILKENDAFYFYGADKKALASLKVVWIYAKGQGRGFAPVPMEAWASTKELEERLADPDPKSRAQAFESLLERKQDPGIALMALHDGDEQVRTRALYGALSRGIALPQESLTSAALSDESADVRFLALQGLAADPERVDLRTIAGQLLNDPHPLVRRRAEEILRRLDPVSPPGPPPSRQKLPPRRR